MKAAVMLCGSIRTIGQALDQHGACPGDLSRLEEVRCMKHAGHRGIWHEGILEDLSSITWIGSASSDIPVPGDSL